MCLFCYLSVCIHVSFPSYLSACVHVSFPLSICLYPCLFLVIYLLVSVYLFLVIYMLVSMCFFPSYLSIIRCPHNEHHSFPQASFRVKAQKSFHHSVICLVSFDCMFTVIHLLHGWVPGHNHLSVASYKREEVMGLFFLPKKVRAPGTTSYMLCKFICKKKSSIYFR